MTSMSNPNPWTPYDSSYADCSQGICNIYCPQWCYLLLPPPPPSFFNDEENSSSSSSSSSPLLIALIGILATAFILVSYYTLISKYCHRHRQNFPSSSDETHHNNGRSSVFFSSSSNAATTGDGLNESVIKSMTVYKYRKEDGFLDGSDCSVCLSEFEDNESLRLLPKCNHAFHLPCIDTWLKSHSNCPLCRSFITVSGGESNQQIVQDHDQSGDDSDSDSGSVVVNVDQETRTGSEMVSRSTEKPLEMEEVNRGAVVLIADILRDDDDDDGDDDDDDDDDGGVGTSRRVEEGEGGEKMSNFVVRSSMMAMKRSVSSGKFVLSSYDRSRNYRLPN